MQHSGGVTPRRGPARRTPQEPGQAPGAPLGLRAAPSGRVPQWVVDEALERQRRSGLSPRARRREARRAGRVTRRTARRWARGPGTGSRTRRMSPAAGVLLVMALAVAPTAFDRFVLPHARPYFPNASAPPPGVEASGAPLGSPPAVADAGGHRFMESPDPAQEMVAFDPCRPVHYVVRPDNAPPGGQRLVEEAVAEVSAATGLRFVHDGTTTEAPGDDRDPYQPERYGKRWAPVLIAWSDPAEVPGLAGKVAGLGGGVPRRGAAGPFVSVPGQVVLDAPDLRQGGADGVRAVIMHELAHVAGLGHVDDPQQLMHPESSTVTGFAAGDRAGLAALGAGPCAPGL